MFGNRKDPMIDTVQKVMDENARRRQIEADLNEELGIQDRKQLGHEKHYLYDQALSQRINEAVLSPKQKSLAAIGGNPKKIDAPDLAKLRGMKNEANEEPPFDPDPPRKKRPDEPKTAKGLAKQAMRDMIAKADKAKPKQNMEEEQTVKEELTPLQELSKKTLRSYIQKAGTQIGQFKYGSKPQDMTGKRQKNRVNGSKQASNKIVKEEEQIDELSKKVLGSYIKKSVDDVKPINGAKMVSKHHDTERRVKYVKKAVDKLTTEDLSLESIQEEIRNNLLERANHLLENGSQEQIVEFMNDLTLEQRSILNLQEQLAPVRPYVAGGNNMDILKYGNQSTTSTSPLKLPTDPGSFKLNIPTPQAVQPGPTPPAPRTGPPSRAMAMNNIVTPGLNSKNDDMSLGNGIVKSIGDTWSSIHNANRDRVDQANDKLSKGGVTRQNRDAELGAAAITGAPAPAAPAAAAVAAGPAPKPPAGPPAAPVAAATPPATAAKPAVPLPITRPDSAPAAAQPATAAKPAPAAPAAQPAAKAPAPRPTPSSVSSADTGGDKYGSGNASAGFERGKYAAPDASDNSSGANELRSKQQAVDRGNLEESKTNYMNESITFERFLRNR